MSKTNKTGQQINKPLALLTHKSSRFVFWEIWNQSENQSAPGINVQEKPAGGLDNAQHGIISAKRDAGGEVGG